MTPVHCGPSPGGPRPLHLPLTVNPGRVGPRCTCERESNKLFKKRDIIAKLELTC